MIDVRARKWSDRISEKTSLSIDPQSITFENHTLPATFAKAPILLTLYSFAKLLEIRGLERL
jgi:hypothetical protein